MPHSREAAAVPPGDSSAPAAIAEGRLSQAGHVSGGVGCESLAAFQPQHGGPLRSFVRLRCVLSFRPFADCFQRGVIFCACGTAGCRLVWGCKLWIAPTPALFFCTFRVARLYCRFTCGPAQTLYPPHPRARARNDLCVSVIAGRTSRFTYRQGVRFDRAPTLATPPEK